MLANSLRPLGREYRMTPCTFEQGAGRLPRPPKSPLLATRTPRSKRSGSVRADGSAIYRDVLTKGIPMNTPPNETPRHVVRGVAGACENTDAGNNTSPASIRRRFGTGWQGYESAKSAWHAANPGADQRQIEAAMRRIARAVKV